MKQTLEEYMEHLRGQERSRATIAKYRHDVGGVFELAGRGSDGHKRAGDRL